MEDIYVNTEVLKSVNAKPSTNRTGPRSSDRSFHSGVIFCLVLLSGLLLLGLITLGVYYHKLVHDVALSAIGDNLTEHLQAWNDQLFSITEERDLLKANLTEMTKELHRLQTLSKQKKTCPAGWRMFDSTCYRLSQKAGSWDKGREDCRGRGADLVVIDSHEEQKFLSSFTKTFTWIGLTDREEEGQWKWIDGTPATLTHWADNQPDNGGGLQQYGEEDCAQIIIPGDALWNDIKCTESLRWICEKIP